MKKLALSVIFFFFLFVAVYILFPDSFTKKHQLGTETKRVSSVLMEKTASLEEEIPEVTHLKTPESVKAVYMSSWVAGTESIRKNVIDVIDSTEINSVVIDIKDYTGKISYKSSDPYLVSIGSSENRIADLDFLLNELHQKDIYVIGRIAVFQDPHFAARYPHLAVKRKSDGAIWKDRKGISWLDPGAKEAWEYIVAIGKEAYDRGFDELNFDYIRFPSDGNMRDIQYPVSEGKSKEEVMGEFFSYLAEQLKNSSSKKRAFFGKDVPVISADLFGMTTTALDDLNIGQVLESAFSHFDYIATMVYPSHYPSHFLGFINPADHPYEVVKFALDSAVARAKIATTSPYKLRPWLQDFNLGATYTQEMVRAQIQATYDAGLTSWMLWDPNNTYTKDALLPE